MQDHLTQTVHVVDPGWHISWPHMEQGQLPACSFLHLPPHSGCLPRTLDAPCCPPVLREGTSPVERCAGKMGVARESQHIGCRQCCQEKRHVWKGQTTWGVALVAKTELSTKGHVRRCKKYSFLTCGVGGNSYVLSSCQLTGLCQRISRALIPPMSWEGRMVFCQ